MKPLRRSHLQVWRTLAVLLPAGIIIAWLSVPTPVSQIVLQPGIAAVLPIVLKKAERENYTVAIRSNENNSALQLEWINKAVLQYPTATIYAANKNNNNINEAKLIGRIEARGNWYFPLDSTFKEEDNNRFILYDFINGQIIDTINLQP
jgi:hypothetical protein